MVNMDDLHDSSGMQPHKDLTVIEADAGGDRQMSCNLLS
jgi:hypothetical protein